MNGIEILTQETIKCSFWDVDVFIVLFIALMGIGIVIWSIKNIIGDYIIPKCKHRATKVDFDVVLLFILGVIIGIAINFGCYSVLKQFYEKRQPEGHYLIKVTEDASFLEFYNNYEILEDKGNNVFIVKEKEN